MTAERRARLAAAIDRKRGELAQSVHRPEDLGTARTMALSRCLDDLIDRYYRYLRHPPSARRR